MGCGNSKATAEVLDGLSASPLVLYLPNEDLQMLGRYVTLQTFDANEMIFEAGSLSDVFYIVKSGSVDLIARSGLGGLQQERFLCSKRAGDWFSESGLLKVLEISRLSEKKLTSNDITMALPHRSTTAKVSSGQSNIELLALPAMSFYKYLQLAGQASRFALQAAIGQSTNEIISQIDLFKSLDSSKVSLLTHLFHYRIVEPRSLVCPCHFHFSV